MIYRTTQQEKARIINCNVYSCMLYYLGSAVCLMINVSRVRAHVGLNYRLSKANTFTSHICATKSFIKMVKAVVCREVRNLGNEQYTEPVFLNVYGALESKPRNEFRQPKKPGGPVR